METLRHRFDTFDSQRTSNLHRARFHASLTIPTLLPFEHVTEAQEHNHPFSSVPARGVVGMASKMLGAMLPLNDMPFFQLGMASGRKVTQEEREYLEGVAHQVHKKLTSKNLRDSLFQVLQYLIVAGDCLVYLEDDFNLRIIRLDHFVVIRDAFGTVKEIIYLDFKYKPDADAYSHTHSNLDAETNWAYDTFYNQLIFNEDGTVNFSRQDHKGGGMSTGVYAKDSCPFIAMRWSAVPGEHYGRSYVEENIGDIVSLEAYTEALMEGLAAASTWWPSLNPHGVTELDDVNGRPNGHWIGAREEDIFILSPANTMKGHLQSTFDAVESTRKQVSTAFLDTQGQVRQAERVTAAEIRMLGQELEQVLGGAFSAVASTLFVPLVKRTIFLMLEDGDLDDRMSMELFTDKGLFNIDIITGLQALSRENDLLKLMQMGDMMRNLPPEAAQAFRWDEYGRALVTSLGFDPSNWIIDQEEMQAQQQQQQAQEAGMQAAQQGLGAGIQQAATTAGEQLAQGAL